MRGGATLPTDAGLRAVLDAIPDADAEIERLRGLIDRDRTGLAAAFNAVQRIVKGYWWLAEGEWGSYDYTQHNEGTLRNEIRHCLEQISSQASEALKESGRRADSAFRSRAIELPDDETLGRIAERSATDFYNLQSVRHPDKVRHEEFGAAIRAKLVKP